jgi:hypothetical protein
MIDDAVLLAQRLDLSQEIHDEIRQFPLLKVPDTLYAGEEQVWCSICG